MLTHFYKNFSSLAHTNPVTLGLPFSLRTLGTPCYGSPQQWSPLKMHARPDQSLFPRILNVSLSIVGLSRLTYWLFGYLPSSESSLRVGIKDLCKPRSGKISNSTLNSESARVALWDRGRTITKHAACALMRSLPFSALVLQHFQFSPQQTPKCYS